MNPAVCTCASFGMYVECVGNKFNSGTSRGTDKKSCMLVKWGVSTGLSFPPLVCLCAPKTLPCVILFGWLLGLPDLIVVFLSCLISHLEGRCAHSRAAELGEASRQAKERRGKARFPSCFTSGCLQVRGVYGQKHSFSTVGIRDKAWVFHQEFQCVLCLI